MNRPEKRTYEVVGKGIYMRGNGRKTSFVDVGEQFDAYPEQVDRIKDRVKDVGPKEQPKAEETKAEDKAETKESKGPGRPSSKGASASQSGKSS